MIRQFLATVTDSHDSAAIMLGYMLFAAMIGGFAYYCWNEYRKMMDKRRKQEERQERYRQKQVQISAWHKQRNTFDLLKETPQFKQWKSEQYLCQDKKCAWCKNPIGLHTQYTHVDHIIPLFQGGNNHPDNLVLSCSMCNKRKGDRIFGYNNESDCMSINSKPKWIKPNKFDNLLNNTLKNIHLE